MTREVDDPEPTPGQILAEGRFHLMEEMGRGAMGIVFRAHDRVLAREVALKMLREAGPERVVELKTEFRRLLGLSHENLVERYELFAVDGRCFFTMEILTGQTFVDRFATARRGAGFWLDADLAELRHCARQLTAGLSALHANGHVHRDVKPSNVMVMRDDRVALLDFGLASPLRQARGSSSSGAFYGTLAYASLEQIFGESPGVTSDWYSAGVMLFEALTGRLPFEGSANETILAKRLRPRWRPGDLVDGIPPSLDELVIGLLDPDPTRRFGFSQVVELLDHDGDSSRNASTLAAGDSLDPRSFVGRSDAMQKLRNAWHEVGRGAPKVVIEIRGVSGIGKSELARRFLAEIEGSDAGLVLRGRCHPQELVPFKALDPLIDELSTRLAVPDADEWLRSNALGSPALLRLFPVLARVPALADAELDADVALGQDPQEMRRKGVQSLRELLVCTGRIKPVIAWIDDLQWGDRDSAHVLRELLRGPDAPPIVLILSFRAEDARDSAILEVINDLAAAGDLVRHQIDLGPLGEAEATLLAEELLRLEGTTARAELAKSLASEADGSPFFVGELVRHHLLVRARPDAGGPLPPPARIAEVTRARIDDLSSEARSIVELVAVAGGPIDASLILELVGLGPSGRPLVFRMRNQSLLREVVPGGHEATRETLETYHDRVRETLLGMLDAADLRARHLQLAEGLSSRPDPDPQLLMRHFLGAGDEPRAALHAEHAAEKAALALAFENAAELYQTAIDLRGNRDEDWSLRGARASALGSAGRSAEAGALYEEAALAASRVQADPETAVTCAMGAAEHYLYAGLLTDGMRVFRDVLQQLDVPVPKNPAAAMRSALGLRLRFFARGTHPSTRRGQGAPSRRDLLRLDAMWKVARGAAMLDHRLGDALALRNLLGALDLGEPSRIVRALCMEAATEATAGGRWLRRRSERLLEVAAELARTTDEPYDQAVILTHRGAVSLLSARFADCVEHCREAEALFRARCTGVAYELNIIRTFRCGALALLGRLRDLAEIVPGYLEEAEERGNRYALAFFRAGDLVLLPLAADDPVAALAGVDSMMAGVPDDHFTSFHFYHLLGALRVEIYSGRGEQAWSRLRVAWPRLRDAGFLQPESLGEVLHYLSGTVALAAANENATLAHDRSLWRTLRRNERFLRRVSFTHGPAMAAVLRAGMHGLRGDRQAQLQTLEEAMAGFDREDMALHRESVRLQLSALGSGPSAGAARAVALAWMESQGVRNPHAMACVIAPAPQSR